MNSDSKKWLLTILGGVIVAISGYLITNSSFFNPKQVALKVVEFTTEYDHYLVKEPIKIQFSVKNEGNMIATRCTCLIASDSIFGQKNIIAVSKEFKVDENQIHEDSIIIDGMSTLAQGKYNIFLKVNCAEKEGNSLASNSNQIAIWNCRNILEVSETGYSGIQHLNQFRVSPFTIHHSPFTIHHSSS
ncbi:hypothetical protein E7Z59_11625 [Robertkochia marina]|uniref:Uncharacterized protein n=1 Tax=Robertkochia marina TaxID=1227945 RepID=A0A4S3LY01_9FLAO|nr:hypothetical protein [Robertkochia marina]THD66449.1 hypothetical protein E7Z59_11625 [Robertkochia marina]TRZ44126.1 hypothetical protein D3A96_09435 [Robertkochia marina]